jgi:hypothetical protein
MNSISTYLDWSSIWENDVAPQLKDESLHSDEILKNIQSFNNEKDLTMDISDCEIQDDELMFQFSEVGGKNESDTQGWYRTYWFKVKPEEDFLISDSGYEQG